MNLKLTPDKDGVIDLTILDDDWFSDLATELEALSASPRTSGADSYAHVPSNMTSTPNFSASSSGQGDRSNILRGQQTVALRPRSGDYQRSALMSESSLAVTKPQYPPYNYADYIPKPKVIYIKSEEQADDMVAILNGAIGLDLEWPFSRDRTGVQKEGKVALVQLCDADIILLVHVSKMERFPRKVKELIESSKVPKMGVNIRNDGRKLFCDYGILSSNLIELGALAGQIDSSFASIFKRPIVSLATVVSYYLKKALDKGPVRTSDWSKDLTRDQMIYASNDVHSGLMVYKSLMKTVRSSKAKLLPENYTADLANELRRPDGGPVGQTSTTLARGSEAPHRYTYTLRRQGHGLLDICIKMGDGVNLQRETVVISHIIRALTEDPALPFSMSALTSLVGLDSSSWAYHRDVIERWTWEGRGIDEKRVVCSKG
ncbi:ribonuclease H-like protein [Lactarius akahatsu]|uniref:Ribonuclease H-like protein n=1 Tax=Lactarius akahatsu TaxID=416441 RepID=A0AAD4QD92_9AGAM|nr:ribonuclease H-like protein [Lactarius akahatsu]